MIDLNGNLEQVSSYYPFGMLAENAQIGGANNKYRYNGKELQDDAIGNGELDWYDYGARMYDPALGRFHTQDRFAEKYASMTPYQYGANNPIKFIDVNGDSLLVSGSASAVSTFENISNTGMGGYHTLGTSSTGKYVLNSTGKTGTMSAEEQATYDMLNEVISNGTDVSFDAIDSKDALSSKVFVGDNGQAKGVSVTPGKHTLDVGDMQEFGTGGLLTAQINLMGQQAQGEPLLVRPALQ
jgi:RHS repeat-associated protein